MPIISQRLFCFVVALLAAGSQNLLVAQSPAAGISGMSLGMPVAGSLLLNSNIAPAVPATLPGMGYSTLAEKSLEGDFGQNKGILPVLPSVSAYPTHNLPEFLPFPGAAGSLDDPHRADVRRQFIPSNNYFIQSGFFCKREWEMEKSTHIPFRFRLGSLAQCNALEGKP